MSWIWSCLSSKNRETKKRGLIQGELDGWVGVLCPAYMWLKLECVWGEGDKLYITLFCVMYICRLKACEQRRSELFEKQGRGQRFTNMKERDSWIKSVCFSKIFHSSMVHSFL